MMAEDGTEEPLFTKGQVSDYVFGGVLILDQMAKVAQVLCGPVAADSNFNCSSSKNCSNVWTFCIN